MNPVTGRDAMRLAGRIAPLLAGHSPEVVGAALADLLATWLAGHRQSDRATTDALRSDLLSMHIGVVKALIPVNADMIRKHGSPYGMDAP